MTYTNQFIRVPNWKSEKKGDGRNATGASTHSQPIVSCKNFHIYSFSNTFDSLTHDSFVISIYQESIAYLRYKSLF